MSTMARSHGIYYHSLWVNYQLLKAMMLIEPNRQLPVAVDQSATEKESRRLNQFDWPLLPTLYRAEP